VLKGKGYRVDQMIKIGLQRSGSKNQCDSLENYLELKVIME